MGAKSNNLTPAKAELGYWIWGPKSNNLLLYRSRLFDFCFFGEQFNSAQNSVGGPAGLAGWLGRPVWQAGRAGRPAGWAGWLGWLGRLAGLAGRPPGRPGWLIAWAGSPSQLAPGASQTARQPVLGDTNLCGALFFLMTFYRYVYICVDGFQCSLGPVRGSMCLEQALIDWFFAVLR